MMMLLFSALKWTSLPAVIGQCQGGVAWRDGVSAFTLYSPYSHWYPNSIICYPAALDRNEIRLETDEMLSAW